MITISKLLVLIDFPGHPSLSDPMNEELRYSRLREYIVDHPEPMVIVYNGPRTYNRTPLYNRACEKFEELLTNAEMVGEIQTHIIKKDFDVFDIANSLSQKRITIHANHTKVYVGGTNLAGCVVTHKGTSDKNHSALQFAESGFETYIKLSLCANPDSSAIGDTDKMVRAICSTVDIINESKLNNKLSLIY